MNYGRHGGLNQDGLERPKRAEATGKLFDAGAKSEGYSLSRWILEAKRAVAVIASSKDCGMIKRTETQKLCQRAKTLLSGADNMEKKGLLAGSSSPSRALGPKQARRDELGTGEFREGPPESDAKEKP